MARSLEEGWLETRTVMEPSSVNRIALLMRFSTIWRNLYWSPIMTSGRSGAASSWRSRPFSFARPAITESACPTTSATMKGSDSSSKRPASSFE